MRPLLIAFAISTCAAHLLPAQTAAADIGKPNFRLYCAPCHGIHAQGGRGPDLTQTNADLNAIISKGVEGTEMRAYAGQFNEAMIENIAAYIRSAAVPATEKNTGDAERGHAIFQGKGACAGCHSSGGIGPPLARIGRQRPLEYLREKIAHPSASITPGYQPVTVKLKDGTTLHGIQKGLDDFSVQLIDANRRFHSFRTDEAIAITQDRVSLMPARPLSESEITDLVAYLATLRGPAGNAPGSAATLPNVHQ